MTTPASVTPELEDESEGEYEVVRSPISWGGASILTFVAAFSFADNADWSTSWVRIWSVILAIVAVGMIFGITGRRRDKKRFPALVGILLNGGVMLTFVTGLIAFLFERYRPF